MKECPYHYTFAEVQKQKYAYNGDGTTDSWKVTTLQKRKAEPCTEDKCGAFYDGHCHFRG